MDGSNVYSSRSEEGRRFNKDPSKMIGEPMEQDDDDATKAGCGCRKTRRRRRRRRIRSKNPFIIFYLEMYFKSPGQRVTEVARQAGKEWGAMSDEDRQKYVRRAERERRRRNRMPRGKRR